LFIAFSTAIPGVSTPEKPTHTVETIPNDRLDGIFSATVQAVEEAIINSIVANEPMTGIDGRKVIALPHDRVREVLKKYGRRSKALASAELVACAGKVPHLPAFAVKHDVAAHSAGSRLQHKNAAVVRIRATERMLPHTARRAVVVAGLVLGLERIGALRIVKRPARWRLMQLQELRWRIELPHLPIRGAAG
jgi:hypothetical protein